VAAKVYSVLIGGKAGEGVKKAAQVIAHLAMAGAKHVFQCDDYQSLIKGGHNFSVVSIADEPVYNSYQSCNLIISFDDRSIRSHATELAEGGVHVVNSNDAGSATNEMIALPLTSLMKEVYGDKGNVSLAAVAIFAALTGISLESLISSISKEFKHSIEENISYATVIYRMMQDLKLPSQLSLSPQNAKAGKFYSGNQLLALGAWVAGMELYFSYPMTPASSILHYLALKRESHAVYAIHAESELAAANMAIGAAFAGKRVAVGSSGGGIALMQEAFSLAGMVEAPLLCFLSSRPGPATGVSTYTAQEDLFFALNQGHGVFPRIVASPDSFERAFSLSVELMDLAWQYQSPAILLTEKHLSESAASIDLRKIEIPDEEDLIQPESNPYQRYCLTDSGVSPLMFPGSEHCKADDVIKWNSNEHLPSGVRTDVAEQIVAMKDKRNRKAEALARASKKYSRVAMYGEGEQLVFAYGSTALELREALKYTTFKLIVPIYLEPFPDEELQEYRNASAIIVEHSSSADFAEFLRIKLGISAKANILRYDGRSWDSKELAKLIQEAGNA